MLSSSIRQTYLDLPRPPTRKTWRCSAIQDQALRQKGQIEPFQPMHRQFEFILRSGFCLQTPLVCLLCVTIGWYDVLDRHIMNDTQRRPNAIPGVGERAIPSLLALHSGCFDFDHEQSSAVCPRSSSSSSSRTYEASWATSSGRGERKRI
jgi:hypothetical protein